jgi:hypothetical protein
VNCSGEFTRIRLGHSEEKILPIIAFGRGFLIELPSRGTWLSQETSEILPSDGVIFYTDGSLCEGRAGAGVFSDTLDIRESYALGSLAFCFFPSFYSIILSFLSYFSFHFSSRGAH